MDIILDNKNKTNYRNIIFINREDAEKVLFKMNELIMHYGHISVADLYDLVHINSKYADTQYGWDNLRKAIILSAKQGYFIRLPRAMSLKKYIEKEI